MRTQQTVTLSFWDILQFKVWDSVCDVKGMDKEFTFGSVYDNNYEFELTQEELKSLGIKIS